MIGFNAFSEAPVSSFVKRTGVLSWRESPVVELSVMSYKATTDVYVRTAPPRKWVLLESTKTVSNA